jgi:hypothetical protein
MDPTHNLDEEAFHIVIVKFLAKAITGHVQCLPVSMSNGSNLPPGFNPNMSRRDRDAPCRDEGTEYEIEWHIIRNRFNRISSIVKLIMPICDCREFL